MKYALVGLLAAGIGLAACANQNRQSYSDAVLSRPTPETDEQRQQECNWIRGEIARQQNLGQMGGAVATTPLMAVAFQAAARKNMAALEARASNVQCAAAFSNAPAPTGQAFDQCFARCQKLTDRTKDQCFDACNK
jgi:hypothetical protein